MAPNSPIMAPSAPGTPHFLARVMAIPALNDAISIASHYYQSTKNNEVVGAAVRATEASMRAAATNALPLATPIINRVGGWDELDRLACQGLDKVKEVAPIITLPTKEIVEVTRRGVFGAVAGDKVIVPPTLTEAVRARANKMVDAVIDNRGVKAATGMMDNAINMGHTILDKYLPKDRADNYNTEDGEGVFGRGVALISLTGHRIYRTAIITMRPDLKFNPQATITTDMMIKYARTKAAELYEELTRETKPGEKRSSLIILFRWPITALNLVQPSDLSMQTLIQKAKTNPTTSSIAMVIESNTNAIRVSLQQLEPTIQQSVERIRSTVGVVMNRVTLPGGDVVNSLASRMPVPVENIIQTVFPMLQESSSEAKARLTEGWEKGRSWAASSGRWAAEEGLVWGGLGLAFVRHTPSIALQGMQAIRMTSSEMVKRWAVEAAVARETRNLVVPKATTRGQGNKDQSTHL